MHKFVLVAGSLAALTCFSPALAQPRSCRTTSDSRAEPVPVDTKSPASMAVVITVGALLSDEASGKLSRDTPCARLVFAIAGQTYQITGENSDPSPRRIVPVSGDAQAPMFYLMRIPSLDGLTYGPPGPSPRIALISVDNRATVAWRVYSGLPMDELLRRDITYIFAGVLQPMALMERGSGELQIVTGGEAADAPAEPRQLSEPDGTIFTMQGAKEGRHVATNFVCPSALADIRRRDFVIYDPPKGRDVSCGYGVPGAASWFTVYLTEIRDASHREVFESYVEGAKGASPGARTLDSPVQTGGAPHATSAAFWQGATGKIEGLTLASIGDWRVKVRISYAPGDENVVERLVDEVYGQAFTQIGK